MVSLWKFTTIRRRRFRTGRTICRWNGSSRCLKNCRQYTNSCAMKSETSKVLVLMFKKLSFALCLFVLCATPAAAQDTEIDRYTINARVDPAASAVDVKATVAVSNLSQSPKPKLFFQLTRLAKNVTATVGGATATVDVTDDRRANSLSQVVV